MKLCPDSTDILCPRIRLGFQRTHSIFSGGGRMLLAFLALLLIPAGALRAQTSPSGTLTSGAGSQFATGANPAALAIGDFNKDGRPDIAIVNEADGTVTILLSNGSGVFTAALNSPFSVGNNPKSIATGDFDGDGNLDLIIANGGSNSVTVLFGDGNGGFTASSPFATGANPESVVVGDFNKDGKLDVATANHDDGSITVLLGNGSGGFAAAPGSPFAVGTSPQAIAAGDFDLDTKLDLIVAYEGGTVRTFRGDGTGAFTSATQLTVNGNPTSLVVGDFNGDGRLDFANTDFTNSKIRVFLGDGMGGFTEGPGSPFSSGGVAPYALVIGDFNGDGYVDLGSANVVGNDVTIYLGNGLGNFALSSGGGFTNGNTPLALAVADFDGDGKLDLVTANFNGNNVSVLLGGAASTTTILTAPSQIHSTDGLPLSAQVNGGPGYFDAPTGTVTFESDGTVLGTGTLSSGVATYTASGVPQGTHLLTAVYSGDARNAGSTSRTSSVAVDQLLQTITFNPLNNVVITVMPFALNATASSGLAVTFTSNTTPVCTVSGTTLTVVTVGLCSVTANQPGSVAYSPAAGVTQTFNISPGSQTISFGALSNKTFGAAPFSINASSNSGLPVIFSSSSGAVCAVSGDLVTVFGVGTCSITALQPGTANYNAAAPVTQMFNVTGPIASGTLALATGSLATGSQPLSAAVGDFNGDGNPDLIVANLDGTLTVLLSNGNGGFTPGPGNPVSVSPASGLKAVAVGDFNGDGNADVAVADGANKITILLGNGHGGFTTASGSPFAAGTGPVSLAIGDFNADGKTDLAVANSVDNTVSVLLGDGSGKFTAAAGSPLSVGNGPASLAVGDFNGDGKEDLAVANSGSNTVTVLLGNGIGGFTPASSPPIVGATPVSLAVGDLNHDGNLDLVIANSGDNTVTVLLGNGLGGFAPAAGSPFAVGNHPQSVVIGDINGDGNMDVAVADRLDGAVRVLLGDGAGGFAPLGGSSFAAGSLPDSLVLADFNSDGRLDAAVANQGSNSVTLLLGSLAPTAVVLTTTAPNTIVFGQSVPLTAQVSDAGPFFNPPAGTVTFMDGTNTLGTVTLAGGMAAYNADLTGGAHNLTAVYGGDTRNAGGTSSNAGIQVESGYANDNVRSFSQRSLQLYACHSQRERNLEPPGSLLVEFPRSLCGFWLHGDSCEPGFLHPHGEPTRKRELFGSGSCGAKLHRERGTNADHRFNHSQSSNAWSRPNAAI